MSEPNRCTCQSCPECGGSGFVWWTFAHQKYLGNRRCDDLDEMESCEECRGGGANNLCDYCMEKLDDEDFPR